MVYSSKKAKGVLFGEGTTIFHESENGLPSSTKISKSICEGCRSMNSPCSMERNLGAIQMQSQVQTREVSRESP
jgi:hypothetical protein